MPCWWTENSRTAPVAIEPRRMSLRLRQLRVFRPGLLQHRNVRIRILPQREKLFVFGAGFVLFSRHCISAAQSEVGQYDHRAVRDKEATGDQFLKLCNRGFGV